MKKEKKILKVRLLSEHLQKMLDSATEKRDYVKAKLDFWEVQVKHWESALKRTLKEDE